jgi:putative phage-type endonuclease
MSNKELIQGSDEWFKVRMGKITASKLSDLMKKTKYGESTYKTRLRMELAIERLTGKSASPNFMNQAMHDGVERQPYARTFFEAIKGKEVALCGSLDHPEIVNTSASPDGLIRGEDAVLEIKCPTHITHAKNLLSDKMPRNYEYQVQWQIACTESEYAYFASYHPDFPPELRLTWVKVLRDNMMILDIEDAVRQFDIEVEDLIIKLKKGANKDG